VTVEVAPGKHCYCEKISKQNC